MNQKPQESTTTDKKTYIPGTNVALPPPFYKELIKLAIRVLLIVTAIITIGCFVVAQPSSRKNQPSNKSTDENRLRDHVVALSETFHPRDWLHPQNLNKSADYIADHFRKAGAIVEFQNFNIDDAPIVTYRNVIARFGVGKSKKIILGAHYDSCADTPGADDNASGVSGLIELAYLFGKNAPDCEIEMVAYTLEEPPFFGTQKMGSAIHAKSIAHEKERIIGVINLEMIGYFSDEAHSQRYPIPIMKGYYPSRGNFITVVSKWDQSKLISKVKAGMKGATDLPVYSFRGPAALQGIDFSDHRNYWPHGIQAVMITNTAFYRNRAYHTINDTANRLDYKRMGKVVIAVYEACNLLAK